MKLIATDGEHVGVVLTRNELLHLFVCWNAIQHKGVFSAAFADTLCEYGFLREADETAVWEANMLRTTGDEHTITSVVSEVMHEYRKR